MDVSRLQEYLSLYGADTQCWPDDIRCEIDGDPETIEKLRVLVNEEYKFENMLLDRRFEHHDPQLYQQIIKQSLVDISHDNKSQNKGIFECFLVLLQDFLMRPTVSVVATLMIGLVLGYSSNITQKTVGEDSFSDFSMLLYYPDDILYYQGDML